MVNHLNTGIHHDQSDQNNPLLSLNFRSCRYPRISQPLSIQSHNPDLLAHGLGGLGQINPAGGHA